jgi:hypothetical protein
MPRCLFIFPVFLFCFVVAAAPARAETQPGSPEHAVRMVYEGGHSLNYAMMAEHACMTEQERAELKAFFAAQIQELRAAGVDFDAISYDFSHLKYTLVEQDRDLARVRIEGPYAIIGPGGADWDQDPDLVIAQRLDGQWKMCGDQTRSSMPLAQYRAWLEDPASVAGSAPVAGPSPVEVTRAFCEAVFSIDAPGMRRNMCRAMRTAGLAEMAEGALQKFEGMGVDWNDVRHDFSGLHYELVRQEGGMAEVRLSGTYVREHPVVGGREQHENQIFTLKNEDDRWVICE